MFLSLLLSKCHSQNNFLFVCVRLWYLYVVPAAGPVAVSASCGLLCRADQEAGRVLHSRRPGVCDWVHDIDIFPHGNASKGDGGKERAAGNTFGKLESVPRGGSKVGLGRRGISKCMSHTIPLKGFVWCQIWGNTSLILQYFVLLGTGRF